MMEAQRWPRLKERHRRSPLSETWRYRALQPVLQDVRLQVPCLVLLKKVSSCHPRRHPSLRQNSCLISWVGEPTWLTYRRHRRLRFQEGLLASALRQTYFSTLLAAIANHRRPHHYHLQICPCNLKCPALPSSLSHLLRQTTRICFLVQTAETVGATMRHQERKLRSLTQDCPRQRGDRHSMRPQRCPSLQRVLIQHLRQMQELHAQELRLSHRCSVA